MTNEMIQQFRKEVQDTGKAVPIVALLTVLFYIGLGLACLFNFLI